jgi:hypothetical protein
MVTNGPLLSTFFEYAQGRFNYIYGGDINNDGSSTNDLIYVPTTTEIATMAFSGGPLKVRHSTGLSVKISI